MKTKKIAVVARSCNGGVGVYVEQLLKKLNDVIPKEYKFFLVHDMKLDPKENKFNNFYKHYIHNKNRFLWDYKSTFVLKKISPDVIVYMKNFIPMFHFKLNAKKILIVHSLIALQKKILESGFLIHIYTKIFSKYSYKNANRIIAVSESTKKDILKNFGDVAKSKVKVIYEAVSDDFKKVKNFQKTLDRYKISKPYIYYGGALSPRKNILRLLKAFNRIKDELPHNIYISGLLSYRDEEVKKYINKILRNRVFLIGKVPLQDLKSLYTGADLYVYPSLYEGFGLPILEAQACGCPVLTSNVTSCPEVAGEGAHIVNPYSEKEISDGIKKILQDKKYREKLIKNGYKNLERFGWEESAKQLLEIVENV